MNRTYLYGLIISITPVAGGYAATNIDPGAKHAWGENIGWLNWRDANGGSSGVRIHPTYLSGFIWAENVGWINIGSVLSLGQPHHLNDLADSSTFGVNIDPTTHDLFGLAWGENIGWVNFDTVTALSAYGQQARYDSAGGRFRGYAWGENVGWINLDDATHFVARTPHTTTLVAASSRRQHGTAGIFDISMTLGSTATSNEPRIGNAGTPQVVLTFDTLIEATDGLTDCGAEVMVANGTCESVSIFQNTLTVNMIFSRNKCVVVTLDGIRGAGGGPTVTGTTSASILTREGNVNGDNAINLMDLQVVKNSLLVPVSSANFTCDVTGDGSINLADLQAVKNNLLVPATCP